MWRDPLSHRYLLENVPWVALEKMFDDVGGEALVTQKGDGCPIPGNIWLSLDTALSNLV